MKFILMMTRCLCVVIKKRTRSHGYANDGNQL
jgi:hypothetical protein